MRGAMAGSAAFMLVLAGCDGAGETGARKTIEVTGEAPYVEQLKALGEMNRGLALRRAIQDSGERCKRVHSSGYQQDYRNLSMWTARCSDSGDWALFVAPNGAVPVTRCEDAAYLALHHSSCQTPPA